MKQLLTIFILLLALTCCTTESDRNRMRAGLDSINQRNRNDQPFTVADVEPYVQFFDDHGTPNDRLLAHYLLGRAYYEAGEAPMALECYQEATECADTTRQDCDYPQLSRVYGQQGELFHDQGLYRQELLCDKKAEYYAMKGKDTMCYLMTYEQESYAYRKLGEIDSALYVIEDVYNKYIQSGYPSDAAISLGAIFRILLEKGDYQKVKRNMELYESKSGLFDSLGNIETGREIYYNIKGYYYLKTGNTDSAKYFFYKELQQGLDYNNQNSAALGLGNVYQELCQFDSASKYFAFAYAMNDSMYAQKTTETVQRINAMYNSSRHQKEARIEREKANQRSIIIWICIGVIIIICFLTIIIIRELTRKRKMVEQKYLQSLSAIELAQSDIVKLLNNAEANRELISEKEQIIREQETILKALLQRDTNSQSLADRRLKETVIYEKFEQLSVIGQKPTNEEWKQMEEKIFKYYPGFKDLMSRHYRKLNDKEYKACLLIRVGFKPKMVSHMLEVDPSYITNIRTEMLQKIFNLSGNSKTFDKMLKQIY